MNHAGLNLGQGEHGGDRFRKSFQPIDYRNQNVADPTVSDLGDHSEPELRSLALLDPDPQNVLGPVGQHPQRQINCFILDRSFIANLDPQRIKKTPPGRAALRAGSATPVLLPSPHR